jgi:hypothetical protein
MMKKSWKWQSGFADIAGVAVGILILGITMAGTTSAIVYSREVMAKQEHYKQAAYVLRGEMENVQAGVAQIPSSYQTGVLGSYLSDATYPGIPLDLSTDHHGNVTPVNVVIYRFPLHVVQLPEIGLDKIAYFTLKMQATWVERDDAENSRTGPGQVRQIEFTTSFVARSIL